MSDQQQKPVNGASYVCTQCSVAFTRKAGRPVPKRPFCSLACRNEHGGGMAREFLARFWEKVVKTDGCWEWTGALSDVGYGITWRDGKLLGAHRASWEMVNGPIQAGLFACHHCDNRKCVKPAHMFLGTAGDNMADAIQKGRPVGRYARRSAS